MRISSAWGDATSSGVSFRASAPTAFSRCGVVVAPTMDKAFVADSFQTLSCACGQLAARSRRG
jgi:hypothetical protein